MSHQHRTRSGAWGLAPLCLRIAVAATFIMAGLMKLERPMEVQGETAAILANMGVIKPTGVTPHVDPSTPVKPLPSPTPEKAPEKKDSKEPRGEAQPSLVETRIALASFGQPDAKNPPPTATPAPTTQTYTAADFPDKQPVKGVYMIAAMLYQAAHPKEVDGKQPMPLWPPVLAERSLPIIFAYMVAGVEVAAGCTLLIGLLTRVSAFGVVVVMAGAMWLTQIGPAIQSGATRFGFLPRYELLDAMSWSMLQTQFTFFMIGVALMCSGPGYLAADNALFGRRKPVEDHDGE